MTTKSLFLCLWLDFYACGFMLVACCTHVHLFVHVDMLNDVHIYIALKQYTCGNFKQNENTRFYDTLP